MLKLLQYCNYIILVMQIKLMLLSLLLLYHTRQIYYKKHWAPFPNSVSELDDEYKRQENKNCNLLKET